MNLVVSFGKRYFYLQIIRVGVIFEGQQDFVWLGSPNVFGQ